MSASHNYNYVQWVPKLITTGKHYRKTCEGGKNNFQNVAFVSNNKKKKKNILSPSYH